MTSGRDSRTLRYVMIDFVRIEGNKKLSQSLGFNEAVLGFE